MDLDAGARTERILDRDQVAGLRRARHRLEQVEPAPAALPAQPATGPWLALVVLGLLLVLAMLVIVVVLT